MIGSTSDSTNEPSSGDVASGAAGQRAIALSRNGLGRYRLDRCQYESLPYRYTFPMGGIRLGRLLRERARDSLHPPPPPGRPSRFDPGDFVRVRDAEAIRATLDDEGRRHGLWFTREQWSYCGGAYQVEHVIRRILNDSFRTRAISGTVSLAGVTCSRADGSGGCGRECVLFFRDIWLEPASAAGSPPAEEPATVVVRSLPEILSTLDDSGKLDGVPFQSNMAAFAGRRLSVLRRADPGLGVPSWKHPRGEWYVLHGARCGGEPLGATGACDRQCSLLWNRAWLNFDGDGQPRS